MMIQEGVSLLPYNTFKIETSARYFSILSSVSDLSILHTRVPLLVLGGGSNMLFTKDFDGWVIKNELKGIEVILENADYVLVRVGAGVVWHEWVLHSIENGWGGLENLSLIPGSVGAAPIQNIGAYGVELVQTFHALEAYHIDSKEVHHFSKDDCKFGYRESVFKGALRGQYIIMNVQFKLSKKPDINIGYGAIQQELDKMGLVEPKIKDVSDAVIRIRQSKLPDPNQIGNAGSFFKNPSVSTEFANKLKVAYPGLVSYSNIDGSVKLAAGWLIEQCGWKGVRRGDAGCHEKQALVLVNFGKARGAEILALSNEIIQSVQDKFGVHIEREVNII